MRLATLGGDKGGMRGTSQEAVAGIQGRVHGDVGHGEYEGSEKFAPGS